MADGSNDLKQSRLTAFVRAADRHKAPLLLLAFLALFLVLFLKGIEWQPWIELFNGATWPSTPNDPATMQSTGAGKVTFYLLLTLRTMLNLSGFLGIVGLIIAYRVSKEMRMYSVGILNIMHTRDLSIARGVLQRARSGDVSVDGEEFDSMVEELGNRFDKEELPALLGSEGLAMLKKATINVV